MRKLTTLITIMILALSGVAMTASAQETATSTGCTNANLILTDDDILTSNFTLDSGEEIIIDVLGTGSTYTVTFNGEIIVTDAIVGAKTTIGVKEDGTYELIIEVTDGGVGTEITLGCNGVPVNLVDNGTNTLCHIPPGNPSAAHTITVGSANAAYAHLAHGDTLGACSEEVNSREDILIGGVSIAIFTLREEGIIEIYGNCGGDSCQPVAYVNITILVPVAGEPFIFDDNPDDDLEVWVYFLHDLQAYSAIKVYQVNVMQDGQIIADNLIFFVIGDQLITFGTHGDWFREDFLDLLLRFEVDYDQDGDIDEDDDIFDFDDVDDDDS